MTFHNLRFWRNVYAKYPQLLPQFFQCWENSTPLSSALFGPITILQKDLAWLNCRLHARDAVLTHPVYGSISTQEPDKGKFEHFIRTLLRQKLAEQLEQKHVKWKGITRLDLDTTTAFVRKLQPDSPLKVPMIRMLADAHATPHKLNKMGIFPTPHCKFCFHERADFQHILWHCPRFQNLRNDWPTVMLMRANWPECAETALVFTKEMDQNLKGNGKISRDLLLSYYFNGWNSVGTLNCTIPCRSKHLTYLGPIFLPFPVTRMPPLSKKLLPNMHSCYRLCGSRLLHARTSTNGLQRWKTMP